MLQCSILFLPLKKLILVNNCLYVYSPITRWHWVNHYIVTVTEESEIVTFYFPTEPRSLSELRELCSSVYLFPKRLEFFHLFYCAFTHGMLWNAADPANLLVPHCFFQCSLSKEQGFSLEPCLPSAQGRPIGHGNSGAKDPPLFFQGTGVSFTAQE